VTTTSPWWYDFGTGEIVRTSDGMRWDPRDVPELARSANDRSHPVVDVDEVDRWVLAQAHPEPVLDLMAALKKSLKENPAAGETATGRGADAVESPASVPNLGPAREGSKP